jgi:hypothetical protein
MSKKHSLRCYWFLRIALTTGLVATSAVAQMNDDSSTYMDAWTDDDAVYGYGSTFGQAQSHNYAIDVRITSPLGRSITVTGGWAGSGTVTNSTSLGVLEPGDYVTETTHRGFCNASHSEFTLAVQRKTTRPAACTPSTNACGDGNGLAPVTKLTEHDCLTSSNCCTAANQYVTGFCRRDTCTQCSGMANAPIASQCQARLTCLNPRAEVSLCLGYNCDGSR